MKNKQYGFSQLLLTATVVVAVILVFTLIYQRADGQTGAKESPKSEPQAAVRDFDGSKPLLFSVARIMECTPVEGCKDVDAEEVGLQRFLKVDFAKKPSARLVAGKAFRTRPSKGPSGWTAS